MNEPFLSYVFKVCLSLLFIAIPYFLFRQFLSHIMCLDQKNIIYLLLSLAYLRRKEARRSIHPLTSPIGPPPSPPRPSNCGQTEPGRGGQSCDLTERPPASAALARRRRLQIHLFIEDVEASGLKDETDEYVEEGAQMGGLLLIAATAAAAVVTP